MMIKTDTFVGVTYSRLARQFFYAALDGELNLLTLGKGSLQDCAAYLAGLSAAWVGGNMPSHFSQGLLTTEEIKHRQASLFPGRPAQMRMAEFELLCRGVPVQHTPVADQRCPAWLKQGFAFYKELAELGYQLYPQAEAERQWMETSSEAVFQALLPESRFAAGTLEGRLQRQLALAQAGLNLPDPMEFFEEVTRHRLMHGILPFDKVYAQSELDGLAAAYTCWLAARHESRVTLLGVVQEGQIVIPLKEGNLL